MISFRTWLSLGWFRALMAFMVLLVFVPDVADAQCGGAGLFGRRAARVSRRSARRSAALRSSFRYERVEYAAPAACAKTQVHQAPMFQAPMKQAPVQAHVEEYPSAGVLKEQHYISHESFDIAWDKVPEEAEVLEIPHW